MGRKSDLDIAHATKCVEMLMWEARDSGMSVDAQNIATIAYNMLVDLADVEFIDDREEAAESAQDYVRPYVDSTDREISTVANAVHRHMRTLALALAYQTAYGEPNVVA